MIQQKIKKGNVITDKKGLVRYDDPIISTIPKIYKNEKKINIETSATTTLTNDLYTLSLKDLKELAKKHKIPVKNILKILIFYP